MEDATDPPSVRPPRAPLTFDTLRSSRSRDAFTRIFRTIALGSYFAQLGLSSLATAGGLVLSLLPRAVVGPLTSSFWYARSVTGPLWYVMLVSLAVALVAASRRFQRWQPGKVTARDGGLTLQHGNELQRLAPEDLLGGFLLQTTPATSEVELSLRGGDKLRLQIPEEHAGQDLLDALGLGSRSRTVEIDLDAPNRALHVGLRLYILMALVATPLVVLLIWKLNGLFPSLLALLGFVRDWIPALGIGWWWPQRVVAGADGISWVRLGRRRFIRYSEISRVKRTDAHLNLTLQDGSVVTLQTTGKEAKSIAGALEERMRVAMEENAARATAEGYDVLDPTDKSARTWLEAIEAKARPRQAFREIGFEPDRLRAVLADPTTSTAKRAGAAVALAGSGEEDAPKRIRIAAQVTASPQLRKVLEKLADGERDEAAIEELIATEQEQPRKLPRSME